MDVAGINACAKAVCDSLYCFRKGLNQKGLNQKGRKISLGKHTDKTTEQPLTQQTSNAQRAKPRADEVKHHRRKMCQHYDYEGTD